MVRYVTPFFLVAYAVFGTSISLAQTNTRRPAQDNYPKDKDDALLLWEDDTE